MAKAEFVLHAHVPYTYVYVYVIMYTCTYTYIIIYNAKALLSMYITSMSIHVFAVCDWAII